ncbi:hypothetical protein BXZ70DRAFT_1007185 [Cristinia sonorae]|uniref:BTB domain-containing protein n=1 Tax=Cristinia sonorae TaxID=1940300 RepID=A0A8K0XR55_9AGAR|nr:hypothetical protein BXZ70DRAFT_1007185 [Cristinia sonorae]
MSLLPLPPSNLLYIALRRLCSFEMKMERATKRIRDDEGSQGGEYQRGEVWYEDGNVVLIAEGTTFRVHRGVLSQRSDAFRDMFAVISGSQPVDAEMWEGCPVVHLSDRKYELKHMLTALYDGKQYFNVRAKLDLVVASTMLQLGMKYQIDDIKQEAIECLSYRFPSRLGYFADLAKGVSYKHIIPIVALAWKFELYDILPVAFYWCSQMSVDELIHGWVDEHGTQWRLSPEDQARCLKGLSTLRLQCIKEWAFLLHGKPTERCADREGCESRIAKFGVKYLDGTFPHTETPLTHWWSMSLPRDCQLCRSCMDEVQRQFNKGRIEAWNALPTTFGISNLVQWTIE